MKFEEQGHRHQPVARQHLRFRVTSPAGKAAKGCATASSPALDERRKTAGKTPRQQLTAGGTTGGSSKDKLSRCPGSREDKSSRRQLICFLRCLSWPFGL
ncbi:hypothetical protein PVAP13_1KG366505 [Panicum virgatum]|uniref:Uncharacterized protein n=1 Tax=Panicum virgatum TaxID=38727 RepID=A0A8T0XKM1_PANVG|nr:hypothetical protein PVAP13_1KG366505 [Panicum virgatum]